MSKFSIDAVKQSLMESNVMVLRDMTAPVDLNAGKTLVARQFPLGDFKDNVDIACFLIASGVTHVAFYDINDAVIRMGTIPKI